MPFFDLESGERACSKPQGTQRVCVVSIESDHDVIGLLKVGRICAMTMYHMAKKMEPGMRTSDLDRIGKAFLEKHGARSAPVLLYKFPGATCISINEEVAHGIPGDRVIQPGDLVNIDVSAEMNGYIADTGGTFVMPPSTPAKDRLCEITKTALERSLGAARAGQPINAIGREVEKEAKRGGYTIIRELGGHGVGRTLHEEPRNVQNFFNPRAKQKLKEGTVMTVEPFFTTGKGKIMTAPDGWTLRTTDGGLTAQYEHTIIITKDRPILVTAI
jgi:methionyl aminopeptidase